jgi:hypothetical protein
MTEERVRELIREGIAEAMPEYRDKEWRNALEYFRAEERRKEREKKAKATSKKKA